MSYDVKARQARAASLGFDPGPIDGKDGPQTRAAVLAAVRAQGRKGLPFIHASGLTRIHWHWTAGGYKPSALDLQHYHALIDGDGAVHWAHDATTRLAHTLNANSGAVAIAVCAMRGATEAPWSAGPSPMLHGQITALLRETARLCIEFDIPVSPCSTLSHAEVQPTLGIRQRGKIDFIWLPGWRGPKDPALTGDALREMLAKEVEAQR